MRQLYKVEEELEEYVEICTSNPKISQYLGSSNISIMTAKDGKECKLFLPASEASEIEMQALEHDEDEDDEVVVLRGRESANANAKWKAGTKPRAVLKPKHH